MAIPALSKSQRFWLNHLRQCEKEKLTPVEYCKTHDLVTQRFYHYKSELRKLGIPFSGDSSAHRFIPIKSVESHAEINQQRPRPLSAFNLHLTLTNRLFQLQLNVGQSS